MLVSAPSTPRPDRRRRPACLGVVPLAVCLLLLSAAPARAVEGAPSPGISRSSVPRHVEDGRLSEVVAGRPASRAEEIGVPAGASGDAAPPRAAAARVPSGSPSAVAARLAAHPRLFEYRPDGSLAAVLGVASAEARTVFFPVSQARVLPDGYVPADLVTTFGHPLRALIVDELRAMFASAERDGAYPVVVSGFRSQEYQAVIFEQAVYRQLFRGEPMERDEAEQRASRFVARPGHSQHQLGTTVDLSSWEIGYAIRGSFAETRAGRWLAEHAWEYGFVQPYTEASEARTGYVPEPWHFRWVGHPLAALLWEDAYLTNGYPTADDVLVALDELLTPVAP